MSYNYVGSRRGREIGRITWNALGMASQIDIQL